MHAYLFDMKRTNLLLLALVSVISTVLASRSSRTNEPYKVVCYLGSWANYRPGDGKFVIEDIDPTFCTHLIYGFAKLSSNRIATFDPYLDLKENWGLGAFQRFNGLREKKPGLKTLIAIGGWNEGSVKYSQMVASPVSRRTFINSCVEFLAKYGFDGLDLDWEYPANRGGKPEDKQNFVSLIKELREAFRPYGYLLTAAVAAGRKTIDSAYDIPALARYLDFINLMSYDFHGSWDQVTGHNAPLYPRSDESQENKMFTVDYAVKYWISKGCPANKLILGMPLYGRGFSLQDPNNNGLDAPVNGKGMAGEYTREPGMMGYNEICKMLRNEKGWTTVIEPNVRAPYAFKDKQWIGYDDPKSIYQKVQYLQKMKLGGGMVWSLETDDFKGHCHGQRYPLLRTISEGLNGRTVTYVTKTIEDNLVTREPARITPKVTTEVNDGRGLPCPYSGYFRHPQDCKQFYYCQLKTSRENMYYMFKCSEGTVFSQTLRVCTFPHSEPGCS